MKISFIGGGNMARAIIGGLLAKGHAAAALHVVEIDGDARARLREQHAVHVHEVPSPQALAADCIVLAVKPQHMHDVLAGVRPLLNGQLVLSIAAGIRVADLARWLDGHARIVRAMPNMPALIGAGMSGLYAPPALADADRTAAESILGAVGEILWVKREEQLDAITAVSGSGPAYVFYFIEAVQQAARDLGFDDSAARVLALETFAGATRLAADSAEDVAVLRARVASKGGTTEAALESMAHDRVKDAVMRAIKAAHERARELGDALGKQ